MLGSWGFSFAWFLIVVVFKRFQKFQKKKNSGTRVIVNIAVII